MEQFRMILAIVLSCIVFIGYNYFFGEKDNKVTVQEKTEKIETKKEQLNVKIEDNLKEEKIEIKTKPEKKEIHVENKLYTLKIDSLGASITSLKLKDYREKLNNQNEMKEIIKDLNNKGSIFEEITESKKNILDGIIFSTKTEKDNILIDEKEYKIEFFAEISDGIVIEKSYTFSADSYLIKVDLKIKNLSDKDVNKEIKLTLMNGIKESKSQYGFEGICGLIDNKLIQVKKDEIEKHKNLQNKKIEWISIQDRYFMTSLILNDEVNRNIELALDKNNTIEAKIGDDNNEIKRKEEKKISYYLYFGPKKISVLKSYNLKLEKAVDFGWFDFIARPCLYIMNYIYKIIPNYGIAIIVLTILIKIILWPLGQKSYKSMNQMKKMQPLMSEIREKFKDDKRKMNEETMALYRTYKVNPLGGCLPMIAQIPVFFAFYRMLYEAVELRHAPFIGWINDLSAPDRLFSFNVSSVPFMDPPYGIPVLTIIMGGTMFLQQKMQPPMGDPTQAKMMMFMPIIFTVIFINFSSGLVLYWLINNILSITQQYFVGKQKK